MIGVFVKVYNQHKCKCREFTTSHWLCSRTGRLDLDLPKKHLKEAAQLWKNSLDRWNQYGKIQTRRETAESKAYMCHAVIPKQSMRNFCEIPWCKVECLPFNCIIIVWFHVHCGDAQRQNYINHVFVQLSIQEGHRVIFCTFNHFCYL